MPRAIALCLLPFSFGCASSGDAVSELDARVALALDGGDRLTVQHALCEFVGRELDCISGEGPVPPPPPEGAASGYFWGVLSADETRRDDFHTLSAKFRTDDGLKAGDFAGVVFVGTEEGSGRMLADSSTVDPNWVGVLGADLPLDEEAEDEGTISGMWTSALYSHFGEISGFWSLDVERAGGRVAGTFDFSVDPTLEEEETTEGPIEENPM